MAGEVPTVVDDDPAQTLAVRSAAALRSTWASVAVNMGLAGAQVGIGVAAHSQGLVADGIHSLSDLVADFIVLFAGKHSRKDADEDHPYGHRRFETAASLALGVLLLIVGVGMVWTAGGKLQSPSSVARVSLVALWVALGGLLVKEMLFRYLLAVAKRVKSGMLVANAWHARADAASSLVVSLGIGGNLAGYPLLDPIAAVLVGFLVARMGFGFGWQALHDLVDRSADAEEVAAIRDTLMTTPGVISVHDLRTRKMGDLIAVDAHLEVDATISVEAGHDIAVVARQRVMQRHRVLDLMTHIDPHHRPDLDHVEGLSLKSIIALGTAALLLGTLPGRPAAAAPTLLENVNGYTLTGDHLQRFTGLVWDDGKVLAAGEAAVLARTYKSVVRLDGHGETVLPGLIDAHGHVLELGFVATHVQLYDSASLAEAQARIRAYAAANAGAAWVLGGGWNQVTWKLGRFPTAAELDQGVADRPAVMERVDGHAKWLNSRALAAAGITKDTRDPAGGRIERAADGTPSGVLVDKAMDLVDAVVPPPSDAERRAALRAALRHLNSVGLTGVGDAGVDAHEIGLYRELADEGALPVRIYAMIGGVGADFAALSKRGPLLGYGGDRLTVRSVKLFADGALGSRGAALLQPYSDAPGQKGLLFMTDAEMRSAVATALEAGYQVNVHAIGDAANRQVLDAFAAAYATVGGRRLRNRIEHAQVVAPADIPRFKELDLIASMQPTHATSDMNMAEDRLGPERLAGAYAWRRYLDQGTRIAGGSDFPVESDNPFFGLHAAVTRRDHAGQPPGGWHAEQAMTLLEAFRAFTLDAAYAEHQERTVGSLEPGKWADFIVVDRDPFTIDPQDLWKVGVQETWVAGTRVFDRGSGGAADAAAAVPAPGTPAAACAALAGFDVPAPRIGLPTSGATVERARLVAAAAEGNANGEYCEVTGWIRPVSAGAPRLQFEVNLPSEWNHKLLQMGGGAYDGVLVTGLKGEGLQPASLPFPLRRGYATAGGDGGHQGTAGFDGSFGMNDEALANFGRESVKKVHDVAAALVTARYGRTPARSYFIGSSQGGHEALDAAARYPADFDGVVANYPAYDVTLLHLGSLNVGQAVYANGGAGWLSPAKTKRLTDAVRRTCDPLDGAADGIISNLAACRRAFTLETVKRTLRCAGGADTGADCLSDAQIAAVARITAPYRPGFAIAGAEEFAPWALLEGSRFQISTFGASPVPGEPPTMKDALLYAVGTSTVRYIITRDLKTDPLTFDPRAHRARIEAVARLMDVTDVDLTPFRTAGGKLILVHGTEDDFITPGNSVAYYRRHLARQGRAAMDSFVRFYLVPGLSHGFGSFNAKYDGLGALERWVEHGMAPGTLTAVDENPDARGRTRPMCVFPAWPKYTATPGASLDEAASFTCVGQ